jgi:segregation and condensation protein A
VEQGSESVAGEPRGRAAIYSVELELFEGPLDLLLHLVRRHELDILDIPISFVAEKYLEYLGMMRALDLEIAGDYLVMAATLAWLKSRELLPAQPKAGEEAGADDEEGEDPREALIRRLVEYERFKNAAAELDALPVSGRDVFARGADIEMPAMDPGLAPVTLFRLAEAYYRVLTRAKINKSHEVQIEAVTVAQRMQQLTLMLDERQEFEFEGLFLGRSWSSERELRTMLVVTLMSVLELVKLGVARVQQVPDTEAIRIYRLSITEEARQQIEAYDEDQSFGGPVEPGPPQATEAELDAAEEQALLAEALAGVHGANVDEAGAVDEALVHGASADLGREAAEAVAANSYDGPVLADMSEAAGSHGQVAHAEDEEPDEELRLLAAELAALDAAEASARGSDEQAAEPEVAGSASDEELLAAELAALDATEPSNEQAEPEAAESASDEEPDVDEAASAADDAEPAIDDAEPAIEDVEAEPAIEDGEAEPAIEDVEADPAIEDVEAEPAMNVAGPEDAEPDEDDGESASVDGESAVDEAVAAPEVEQAVDEPEPVVEAESAIDEELRLLAAELAALDAAEAVAEAVTFARGQVQLVHEDETDAANESQDAEDEDDS